MSGDGKIDSSLTSVNVVTWSNRLEDNCYWNIAARQLGPGANAQEVYNLTIRLQELNQERNAKISEQGDVLHTGDQVFIPIEYAIEEVQTNLGNLQTSYTTAQENYSTATTNLATANATVASALTEFNAAQSNIPAAPVEGSDNYEADLAAYNTAVSNRDAAQQAYLDAVQKQAEAQSKLDEATTEMETAEKQLTAAKQELVDLQQELSTEQQEFTEEQRQLEAAIQNFDTQIQQAESQLETAKAQAQAETEAAQAAQTSAQELGVQKGADGTYTLDATKLDSTKLQAAVDGLGSSNVQDKGDGTYVVTNAMGDAKEYKLENGVLVPAQEEESGAAPENKTEDYAGKIQNVQISTKDDDSGDGEYRVKTVTLNDGTVIEYVEGMDGKWQLTSKNPLTGQDGRDIPTLDEDQLAQITTFAPHLDTNLNAYNLGNAEFTDEDGDGIYEAKIYTQQYDNYTSMPGSSQMRVVSYDPATGQTTVQSYDVTGMDETKRADEANWRKDDNTTMIATYDPVTHTKVSQFADAHGDMDNGMKATIVYSDDSMDLSKRVRSMYENNGEIKNVVFYDSNGQESERYTVTYENDTMSITAPNGTTVGLFGSGDISQAEDAMRQLALGKSPEEVFSNNRAFQGLLSSGGSAEPEADVTAMRSEAAEARAMALYAAMDGGGTCEATVEAIVNGLSGQDLVDVMKAYEAKYGKSLEDAIKGDFSGSAEGRLLGNLDAASNYASIAPRETMDEDTLMAARMLAFDTSTVNIAGTNEEVLSQLILGMSNEELVKFAQYYEANSGGRTLRSVIESETSGDYEDALISRLNGAEGNSGTPATRTSDPAAEEAAQRAQLADARATTLFSAIDGIGTDEDAVEAIITGLSGQDLLDVMDAYEAKYGKSLEDAIKGDFSGSAEGRLLGNLDAARKYAGQTERETVNADAVTDAQATSFIEATTAISGTNEDAVFELIINGDRESVRRLAAQLSRRGCNIYDTICSEFSGSTERTLLRQLELYDIGEDGLPA